MIAEINPQTGGAPEATAIPSESGIPIMATWRPAMRSYFQCFSPATPFWGFSSAGISSAVTVAAPCDDMPVLLNFRFRCYAVKLYALVFSRRRQCFIVPLVLEVPVVHADTVSVEGLALGAHNEYALIKKCFKMRDVTELS
jgi:hypothetical protein